MYIINKYVCRRIEFKYRKIKDKLNIKWEEYWNIKFSRLIDIIKLEFIKWKLKYFKD